MRGGVLRPTRSGGFCSGAWRERFVAKRMALKALSVYFGKMPCFSTVLGTSRSYLRSQVELIGMSVLGQKFCCVGWRPECLVSSKAAVLHILTKGARSRHSGHSMIAALAVSS